MRIESWLTWSVRFLLRYNLRTVVPGRVYRSAQLPGWFLERTIRRLGIRTVINLRGWYDASWYHEECRVTGQLGVTQVDIPMRSSRLPRPHELQRLVHILDQGEGPMLLHCHSGADRSGLASGLALLLQDGPSLSQARRQLGLRFGHLPLGRGRPLDRFFDLYGEWLHNRPGPHSPSEFRNWLVRGYEPNLHRGKIEAVEVPTTLCRGEIGTLRVRVHNTCADVWILGNTGIRVGYSLRGSQRRLVEGHADFSDYSVLAGQSIERTIHLPALTQPGNYDLVVDLIDEQGDWFHLSGSQPVRARLRVR